jgi:hypothetical protein
MKLWILVRAMVEDVPQRKVLLAAVRLRRDGWRWEDGELGCTAHGEERQQQGSCYARCRGAERSATHVVIMVQSRSTRVKWVAASEVQLPRWHAPCINDDDGIHAAGANCTCYGMRRGDAPLLRNRPPPHGYVLAAYFHGSHIVGVE